MQLLEAPTGEHSQHGGMYLAEIEPASFQYIQMHPHTAVRSIKLGRNPVELIRLYLFCLVAAICLCLFHE